MPPCCCLGRGERGGLRSATLGEGGVDGATAGEFAGSSMPVENCRGDDDFSSLDRNDCGESMMYVAFN